MRHDIFWQAFWATSGVVIQLTLTAIVFYFVVMGFNAIVKLEGSSALQQAQRGRRRSTHPSAKRA